MFLKLYKFAAIAATSAALSYSAQAQTGRYIQPIFPNITVTTNIQYGSAVGYGATQASPLLLDIYEPTGDTATLRPLVIAVYGGSFIGGSKEAADIQRWCDTLANLGYIAIAHNYRVGFNPFQTGSVVRAGYRALQDTRAAVRFAKEYSATYKIDTNQIFMVGNSAGAISALQAAYISDSDRPAQTFGIQGAAGQDTTDQLGIDQSTNSFAHTTTVKAIVALWGAVLDTNMINTNDNTSVLMIHGDADSTVPIDIAPAFFNPAFPTLYGSRAIASRINSMGMTAELEVYAGQGHNFYSTSATTFNAYWDTIANHGINFLCRFNTYCNTALINVIAVDKSAQSLQSFPMFPNPAHSELTVVFDKAYNQSELFVQLYNIQGQMVQAPLTLRENSATFQVENLANGLYLVQIKTPNGFSAQKFVVQH